ncbi:hypothetical protein AWB78_03922 [Caballeronia calidae]|uniref:Lipoprotein n=1 Tax=Caballeronia calidae TaxID=1777139 RepID=A0A158CGP7_9BURK|nr:hypothetical protein [Caballeronia calidae]SAK81558.1 hypothetical protein AWB78_03922 [Caballeronia calidae]
MDFRWNVFFRLAFAALAASFCIQAVQAQPTASSGAAAGAAASSSAPSSGKAAWPNDVSVLVRPMWLVYRGWSLSNPSTGLVVTTGNAPLNGFRVGTSTLVDANSGETIDVRDIAVCKTSDGECVTPASLPASATQQLFLRLSESVGSGKYTGMLTFISTDRPQPVVAQMDLRVSSMKDKVVGASLLVLGVVLTLLVNVIFRARVARKAALIPVAALRARFEVLLKATDSQDELIPDFRTKIRAASAQLSVKRLSADGLLPPKLIWYSATNDITGLQNCLRDGQQTLMWMTRIVNDGVMRILDDTVISNDTKRSEIQKLDTSTEVNYLDKLQSVDRVLDSSKGFASGGGGSRSEPSVQHLTSTIQSISLLMWLFIAVLTALSGITTLILPNSGFGTTFDMWSCFLWGFGIPTVVSSIAQVAGINAPSTLSAGIPR